MGVCGEAEGAIFNGNCFQMTSAEMGDYPSMSFTINGISTPFTLSGPQYLIELDSGGNTFWCLGVSSSGGTLTILGDVFMQYWNVAFDRAASRVGFAPTSTCPTAATSSSGKHPYEI